MEMKEEEEKKKLEPSGDCCGREREMKIHFKCIYITLCAPVVVVASMGMGMDHNLDWTHGCTDHRRKQPKVGAG